MYGPTPDLATIDPTLIEMGHGKRVDITRTVRTDERTGPGRHAAPFRRITAVVLVHTYA